MKFKIGDWVYAFQEYWDNKYYKKFKNNPGQIKYINSYGQYAIEFENPSEYFYTYNGHCKDKHGYWIYSWEEKYLTYAYTLSDKIAFIKELL